MKPADLTAFGSKYGMPILYPTPNRIKDATYTWQGKTHVMTKRGQKILRHGLVMDEPFTVRRLEAGEDSALCEAEIALREGDALTEGYPFPSKLTVRYTLTKRGVHMDLTVRNDGALPMPLGTGFHAAWNVPLFPGQRPLDCRLQIPVRRHWLHDPQTIIPTGETVTDSPLLRALREGTLVPEREALSCLLELDEGPVRLTTPRGNLVCTREAGYPFLMLWNGGGGQGFVCPEPQSWLVDAPNLSLPPQASGFTALVPGQSATTRLRYALELK